MSRKTLFSILFLSLILFLPSIYAVNPPLLSGSETKAGAGFMTSNLSSNYDELLNKYFSNSNTSTVISNTPCGSTPSQGCLWVPWMDSSSSCIVTNFYNSTNNQCNSGQSIDFTHNCMVTDELSQVCIEAAMGRNQTRFQQCYNILRVTNSSYGQIPAWKVYRDGTTIEACRSGINSNCDTASDATHRFIIALYTAANNSLLQPLKKR